MIFYKYMPKKYCNAFVENGSLRIGTLYDFTKTENYNDAIGDKDEGRHYPRFEVGFDEPFTATSKSQEMQFLKGAIEFSDGASGTLENISYITPVKSRDLFIFCMSSTFDLTLMKSFECDTCVEISRPGKLLKLIDAIMKKNNCEMFWQGQVKYTKKEYLHRHDLGFHPATTKDIRFTPQQEYRCLWQPKGKDQIIPINIEVPKASKLFKKIV